MFWSFNLVERLISLRNNKHDLRRNYTVWNWFSVSKHFAVNSLTLSLVLRINTSTIKLPFSRINQTWILCLLQHIYHLRFPCTWIIQAYCVYLMISNFNQPNYTRRTTLPIQVDITSIPLFARPQQFAWRQKYAAEYCLHLPQRVTHWRDNNYRRTTSPIQDVKSSMPFCSTQAIASSAKECLIIITIPPPPRRLKRNFIYRTSLPFITDVSHPKERRDENKNK